MKRKFVKVQMNNKTVKFQLNTGSDVTLINIEEKTISPSDKASAIMVGAKNEWYARERDR